MRLFAALDIPENVRASLARLTSELRAAFPNARWTRIEGLHLTLKFIGETPAEKVGEIQAALASIASRPPMAIQFRGLGFFPSEQRPRVLWAGVEADQELAELAAQVNAALYPLGVPREERAFSPHLTLARLDTHRGLESLQAAIANAGALEFGGTVAEEFYLYQSVLKPGGAEYTRLSTFSFTERKTE